tara:strand:- start:120 stop:371 length:252 start_codon:yes stop_codon:yes gene_type:complete
VGFGTLLTGLPRHQRALPSVFLDKYEANKEQNKLKNKFTSKNNYLTIFVFRNVEGFGLLQPLKKMLKSQSHFLIISQISTSFK